jgi:D-tyrosyl-tRNA(Tyr) deacylase
MRLVIQRVSQASVTVDGEVTGSISHGLLILLGIETEDSEEDIGWLVPKVVGMRIFQDPEDKMNLDISQVGGDVLLVSQFTLHASTRKGNRPSFIRAARPEQAIPLYEKFRDELSMALGKKVECGIFGAMMEVALVNDGPVTIIIDSKNRE